jgi:hypothetical protein
MLAGLWVPVRGQEDPQTPIVAKVHYRSWAELNAVAGSLDVWEVRHAEHVFVAALSAGEAERLRAAGFQIEPAPELAPASRPLAATAQDSGIPGFACYRTVEETYADLAALAAAHPNLASWIDIGNSWDKATPNGPAGHDLHALVLTNQAQPGPKFKFVLMAAIHARELATAELAARFAEQLVADYGIDPDVTWLLDYGEFHLLPQANPDGRKFAEEGFLWRKNTNRTIDCPGAPTSSTHYGVDLNRNSSFKWNECEGGACSSSSACTQTYRGAGPASEPETQAIQNYLSTVFADQRGPNVSDSAPADTGGLFISVHSYGQLVLFPWGYSTSLAPNGIALQTLGRKFGYHTGYVVCQAGAPGCLYMTDGTTDDWGYGELGVASYTFEIGTSFFQDCSSFENTIQPAVTPALTTAFKAARRPYQSPSGPDALNVTITPTVVVAGQPVTFTAALDDTRFDANALHLGVESTQNISTVVYSVGAPTWVTGTATALMAATDGAFDEKVENASAFIDTTGWSPGRHLVFGQGQDADGNWGAPAAAFVTVLPLETRAVVASVSPPTVETLPGRTASFLLRIANQGVLSDTYALETSSAWPVNAPVTVGPLASLEQTSVIIEVTAPITVAVGMTDAAIIRVTSTADQEVQATAVVTTRAIAYRQHLPLVTK